jgi:acetyl-CoA carboxylase carboxyl transferase subunit alpha
MFQDYENRIKAINAEIRRLEEDGNAIGKAGESEILRTEREALYKEACRNIGAQDRVYLARHPERPNASIFIEALFKDFFELHGDRLYGDDESVIGGIALFDNQPVTVIGHCKGKSLEENLRRNFGMPNPEGYRKAMRLMEQADKFGRPIITFIDTPGAYPGVEAEERGQGEAIAKSLMTMSRLGVPVISVVIGEGGSGGALALSVANIIVMLENSVFSVLSPEGFASILWKDEKKSGEACELMKLTAQDLYKYKIADHVVPEPFGGIKRDSVSVFMELSGILSSELIKLKKMSRSQLKTHRYKKFRGIGKSLRACAQGPDGGEVK